MASTQTDICNLSLSLLGDERLQFTDIDVAPSTKITRQCLLHYDTTLEEVTRLHTWNCSKKRTELASTESGDNPQSVTPFDAGDTTWNTDLIFVDTFNGAPRYSEDGTTSSTKIGSYNGATWELIDESSNIDYTNPETGLEFPQTGWVVGLGTTPAPEVNLNSFFNWDTFAKIPNDSIRLITLSNNRTFYRMLRFTVDWQVEGDFILSNSSAMLLLYQIIPPIAEMDALFLRAFYTALAIKLAIPLTGDRKIRQELQAEFEQIIMPEARRVNGFEGYEHPVVDSEFLEATITPTTGIETWQALSVGDLPM